MAQAVFQVDRAPMRERTGLCDRALRLKEQILAIEPQVDVERIDILLRVYKETEGERPIVRRAKLFERMCREKTIFIDDNPFVGTVTRFQIGHYPYPEYGCESWTSQKTFGGHFGRYPNKPEYLPSFEKAIEYWKDKNVHHKTMKFVKERLGIDLDEFSHAGVFGGIPVHFTMPLNAPDMTRILKSGFNGVIAEMEEARSKLDIGLAKDFDKLEFYDSAISALKSVIELAGRYAALAREMAEKETDPERKQELEEISQRCQWVPANPPRTFREAIQFQWFVQVADWIECGGIGTTPGRFPQYMYPYYIKDKQAGRIDDEEAIGLIQLYFLKLQTLSEQIQQDFLFLISSARVAQMITLGGVTRDGKDATNELDYFCIEAQLRNRLPEPLLNLVYHDKLPEELLLKSVELIRTGIGQPAVYNSDVMIQRNLLHHASEGVTLQDARDSVTIGCTQNVMHGTDSMWEVGLNVAKMMELALNNGKDPLTGLQVGPQTGDCFATYAELEEAVREQLRYCLPLLRKATRMSWQLMRDYPTPFASALIDGCVKKGEDQLGDAAKYTMASGTVMVAVVDLANSLAAIKKLVYEDKKITLEQLKEALAANFEGNGYREIQKMCLRAPKYGNDDDYVDSIAKEWFDFCWEEHQKIGGDYRNRLAMPEAFSVEFHTFFGAATGALPEGREARVALTDASVSAHPGTDTKGPTALVNSAVKVLDAVKYGTNHLNMKFHPSTLEGMKGAKSLISLIKTYCDLGGYHIQFNCVSGETLRDAQLHPEKYRGLVVRVAGFSAFFVALSKMTQDEIISRTELKLGALFCR